MLLSLLVACLILVQNNAPFNFTSSAIAIEPDWSSSAKITPAGRTNIYQWDEKTFSEKLKSGKIYALSYPVVPTGLLLPARPVMKILSLEPGDPLFGVVKTILSLSNEFKNFKGFWDWAGLHDYPEDGSIPFPNDVKPDYPMGVSVVRRNGVDGFTLSCAACHSAELFGKKILGMTNRFPRANSFFAHGQVALEKASPSLFGAVTGASKAEREMYREARDHVQSIGVKQPVALGLDTSLAQVALSLAKRKQDNWATRTEYDAHHPRANQLDHQIADSKPAVWWNVKYKNRWLSDGSVISGNPVFTNFLWNEIGRGVDLPELVEWLEQNSKVIEDLTTAVFATEAPKWREFFGDNNIQIERAKRGEVLYKNNCINCHGSYEKAWTLNTVEFAALKKTKPDLARSDTVAVNYFAQTPIKDVGTDSGRREGMRALEDALNPLAFSQKFKIVIQEQKGYVPPPLDGIWARYPYFHNNSIPTLCALMTSPESRPKTYYARKALNKDLDFDANCVGYPTVEKTQAQIKKEKEYFFDTQKEGLSNKGHYERIFQNSDKTERYTPNEKKDLIEFLKTL